MSRQMQSEKQKRRDNSICPNCGYKKYDNVICEKCGYTEYTN